MKKERPKRIRTQEERDRAQIKYYYNKVERKTNQEAKEEFGKGVDEFELGKYKEAIKYFDTAISLNPSDKDAFLYRALAEEKLEQYEKAVKDYDKVIELDPTHAIAIGNRKIVMNILNQGDLFN